MVSQQEQTDNNIIFVTKHVSVYVLYKVYSDKNVIVLSVRSGKATAQNESISHP